MKDTKKVLSSGACLNCLHPTHTRRDCKSKHRCGKCQRNHHTLLHFDSNNKHSKQPEPKVVALTQSISDTVLLATALIFCYDSNDEGFLLRAMVDQGSMASIITERAAQLLRAPRKNLQIPIKTVGDTITTTTRQFINLKYSAAFRNAHQKFNINALS